LFDEPPEIDDGELTSDSEDYKESDFEELMSKNQIERSILEQFNKLKEIMNPIDEDRLKCDAVNNAK
jgi:hypothetical protein